MCYRIRDHISERKVRARQELPSTRPELAGTPKITPVFSKLLARLGVGKRREVKKRHLQEA